MKNVTKVKIMETTEINEKIHVKADSKEVLDRIIAFAHNEDEDGPHLAMLATDQGFDVLCEIWTGGEDVIIAPLARILTEDEKGELSIEGERTIVLDDGTEMIHDGTKSKSDIV